MSRLLALPALALSLLLPLQASAESEAAWTRRTLRAIPADTPYAFVVHEPTPEAVMDKFFRGLKPSIAQFDAGLAELERQRDDSAGSKVVLALLQELKGKLSPEGLSSLGLDLRGRSALYGIGLLPVYRMSLGDPEQFKQLLKRVEARSGVPFSHKVAGGQPYIHISGGGVDAAIAVIGDEVVAALAPTNLTEQVFPVAFGQQKPARTLEEAGTLAALRAKYAFGRNGVGFIDVKGIVGTLLGDGQGFNADVARSLGLKGGTTPVCRKEIDSLLDHFPRMIMGYEASISGMSSTFLVETKADVTRDLEGLTTQVPGVGGPVAAPPLASLIVGLDVTKAVEVIGRRASAAAKAPYQCPDLRELNQIASSLSRDLANGVPPAAQGFSKGFKGVHVVIEDAKMSPNAAPEITGYALLAHASPLTFVGILSLALPAFGASGLTDNGKVVDIALPNDQLGELKLVQAAAVAQHGKGMVLGGGPGVKARLGDMLDQPSKGPAPVFELSYDIGRFLELVGAGQLGPTEQAQMKALRDLFGPIRYGLYFTEQGPAITSHFYLR